MKKSQIWISVIIYTLVAVLALVIILNTGLPLLTEMKDRTVFTKVKDIMQDLDRHISNLASQGEGSQATVTLEVRDGELRFEDNQLIWELETQSKIMSPRSSTKIGNLIISSNANVKTYEYQDYYLMETSIKNDTFSVKINKKGQPTLFETIDTSDIIEYISYNGDKMEGEFTFSLNNNPDSASGIGYTEMIPAGNNTNLGRAKVVAHMDTDFATYDLEFTLESYADFLIVRAKNFEPK